MNILVLNCGSSSLKFQIIDTDLEKIEKNEDRELARGLIERIGSEALISLKVEGKSTIKTTAAIRDHKAAIQHIIKWVTNPETGIPGINSLEDIHAIGHRTVHGGEEFKSSVRIDNDVIAKMEDNIELAPLHNPANLKGIYAAREVFGPSVPQVAIFDTAFHSTMPETSYLYAIPYQYYRRYKIRKYGFHGTSHRYIAYRYRVLTGKTKEDTNIITLHLGNGSSACAIKHGKSIDTSMGFTPLEGLMMGTRCGDIDPTIIDFLHHKEGSSIDEIFNMLNKRSGLLGISGLTNDMRDLVVEIAEHQDRRAQLAIDMFCARIVKYVGAYLTAMNGADAICFSAGIGENAPDVRAKVCEHLEFLGVKIDKKLNNKMIRGKEGVVSTPDSKLQVFVIPTNEELVIARDTCRVVLNAPLP
ncbi:MAG TPA: acetate kinase [Candidatus Kapabacteria bacterium]|nr:acetate kinase [Candidatus Kapabacteria bacterium]HPP39752.1 acetate kinase [Candidatus Kapabacteria bacterium]HPU23550.1 acetate kinase [Candidatus Kapabacteria bacterium]